MMNSDQWRLLIALVNAAGVLVASVFLLRMARDLWPLVAEALAG